MVLWKYLFELVSKDLEALKRKKRALDDLLSSNRISQQTYDYLNKDVSESLMSMENYFESLISKMKSRIDNLEKQISILEIFLANSEMMYAAGEIDYETYEKQSKALAAGIESMKKEMSEIKSILNAPAPEPAITAKPTVVATPVISEAQEVKETVEQAQFSS